MDTLVTEVVQQGLAAAGTTNDLHDRIVNRVEKELIVQVMQGANNVQTRAATRLGINRNTLRTKLIEYNLVEEEKEGES